MKSLDVTGAGAGSPIAQIADALQSLTMSPDGTSPLKSTNDFEFSPPMPPPPSSQRRSGSTEIQPIRSMLVDPKDPNSNPNRQRRVSFGQTATTTSGAGGGVMGSQSTLSSSRASSRSSLASGGSGSGSNLAMSKSSSRSDVSMNGYGEHDINSMGGATEGVRVRAGLKKKIRYPLNTYMKPEVQHVGFLLVSQGRTAPAKWKRRWAIVKDDSVFCLKQPKDTYATDILQLDRNSSIDISPVPDREHPHSWSLKLGSAPACIDADPAFALSSSVKDVLYFFDAGTQNAKMGWVAAMLRAVGWSEAHATPSSPPTTESPVRTSPSTEDFIPAAFSSPKHKRKSTHAHVEYQIHMCDEFSLEEEERSSEACVPAVKSTVTVLAAAAVPNTTLQAAGVEPCCAEDSVNPSTFTAKGKGKSKVDIFACEVDG
ncbi:hypothetical protein HK102_004407 [Quaeritorhiza haematococci]|nr:hypothetical protein HK102_004407 [Quaeritorhiza haematococci]